MDGSLQLRSFGNQQGFTAGTALTGQTDRVSYRLAGQYVKLGDYTSGDGRTVDADHEGWGESAAIRTHLSEHQSVEVALHHYHQALDRNISLPFDTVDTDFYAATLNYTWSAENHHLYWRSGYTETHPRLSTTARPDDDDDDPTPTPAPPAGGGGPGGPGGPGGGGSGNPPPARPVDTDLRGDTIAYSGGLSWQTTWSSELISLLGVDATWSRRNASRERLLSDNSVNIDHLWPDVRTRDLGLFGELTWNREANHVRFGARIDRVDREARAADGLIIGIPGARGATIRQNYIAFNGPAAGETTRNHTVGAVNFTYEHDLSTKLTARLGLGLTRMAPTESESYRSFLSNPLGVGDLGNPALDPETKREIEAGLQYSSDQLQFTGQIFYAAIDDYIQRTLILTTPSTIFSFRNSDAAYYGAEAALVVTPTATPGLSFNASASTVQGYDRNTRIDQAGLPPWQTRAAVRYHHAIKNNPYWIELNTAYTAAKTNPNPNEATIFRDTASYTIIGLRLGTRLHQRLTLEASVENLFDVTYYNYLTAAAATGPSGPPGSPPVVAAPGTLAPGDSVPGVGRSFNLSARWQF